MADSPGAIGHPTSAQYQETLDRLAAQLQTAPEPEQVQAIATQAADLWSQLQQDLAADKKVEANLSAKVPSKAAQTAHLKLTSPAELRAERDRVKQKIADEKRLLASTAELLAPLSPTLAASARQTLSDIKTDMERIVADTHTVVDKPNSTSPSAVCTKADVASDKSLRVVQDEMRALQGRLKDAFPPTQYLPAELKPEVASLQKVVAKNAAWVREPYALYEGTALFGSSEVRFSSLADKAEFVQRYQRNQQDEAERKKRNEEEEEQQRRNNESSNKRW